MMELGQRNPTLFVCDALADRWEERFAELVAYKRAHGHCEIPTAWAENQALAKWVVNQRVFRKRGNLSPERISRLNSIDFQWKGRRQNHRNEADKRTEKERARLAARLSRAMS